MWKWRWISQALWCPDQIWWWRTECILGGGAQAQSYVNLHQMKKLSFPQIPLWELLHDYPVWTASYTDSENEVQVLVAQTCLILCNPMDCSPPDSSAREILQARILEPVAIPFSKGFSPPRGWTQFSCIAGRFFTVWATREAPTWLLQNTLICLFLDGASFPPRSHKP